MFLLKARMVSRLSSFCISTGSFGMKNHREISMSAAIEVDWNPNLGPLEILDRQDAGLGGMVDSLFDVGVAHDRKHKLKKQTKTIG